MRSLAFFLLLIIAIAACRPPKLARRLRGTWLIEHYDEYDVASRRGTGHDLDSMGKVQFTGAGTTTRRLGAGRPHGSLAGYTGYGWQLQDSILTLTAANGQPAEIWLVSKDLQYFLELISVDPERDTVRTMYLHK